MPKFQKKPVVIDAFQWSGTNTTDIRRWMFPDIEPDAAASGLTIKTLEGEMKASPGDWIIKGVNNEFYPCKPDVFEKTYLVVPKKLSRAEVYKLIDGERDYQEHLIQKYNWSKPKSVGEFLTLIRTYLTNAEMDWTHAAEGDAQSLAQIRKIAALSVACMETHDTQIGEIMTNQNVNFQIDDQVPYTFVVFDQVGNAVSTAVVDKLFDERKGRPKKMIFMRAVERLANEAWAKIGDEK